ncbi:MAG: hypothetical protein MUF55_00600 [Hydrogenophaga sp.]|jgi:hypothetical protein|nr:hypothetical protein [Hydrogenophaga sp.]
MPWRRSERPHPPLTPRPVPDPEQVRRAALAASWQRDRRIAKRRLAWRWLLWFVGRYFLHMLGVVALLLLAGWLLRHPPGTRDPEQATLPMGESGASQARPASAHAGEDRSAWPGLSLIPESTYSALPTTDLGAIELRSTRQLSPEATPDPPKPQTLPADAPADTIAPSLKPENWLHSKEP